MEEIVTILSTREWAITIWGTGFFIWMLTQSEIRKSLWNVIKILLGKNLRRLSVNDRVSILLEMIEKIIK